MSIRHRIIFGIAGAAVSAGALVASSPQIMAFLERWEGGGQNVVYADKLAGGLPTVCKGITKWTSPYPVIVGERWSDEKCAEVENLVVTETQMVLADCLTGDHITQPVFDALTSHAHNFGVYRTCNSQSVRLINAGKVREGCHALAYTPNGNPNWAFVGKRFVQGLHNRRKAEREMCLKGAQK